jgi:hypothetical protein
MIDLLKDPRVLTIRQAAQLAGLSYCAMLQHVKKRHLPSSYFARNYIFSRGAFDVWFADYQAGKYPMGRPIGSKCPAREKMKEGK